MPEEKRVRIVRNGVAMRVSLGRPRFRKADDYVVHLLSAAIVRGDLESGDRLPSQEEIGAALGMSRFSVGNGLKKLRDKGFVSGSQGARWYVV